MTAASSHRRCPGEVASPSTSAPPLAALLLALLLALDAPLRTGAVCSGNTYSYGSGACASCAAGASFVSAAAGCTPSATLTAGPTDTAFYLSGSQAEGVAALAATGASPTYAAGVFGAINGALVLASGAHLDVAGASAPAALPSGGNIAWSASTWIKCGALPGPWAGVLEWGAAGDAQGAASAQAAALVVSGVGVAPAANSGVVTTLAGSGSAAFVDGTGAAASFSEPFGVVMIPSSGMVVVADMRNNRIRQVTPLGVVTTLAGSGSQAFADGTGAAASFNNPYGVAVIPSSGVVVVADTYNCRIRLVTPLGVVTTLAGSGSTAFADGTGAAASFWTPTGVAVIPSSSVIVVADTANNRIRLVTPLGVVTTLAGSGSQAFADGTGAAASFHYPYGVAVIPSSGMLVVVDQSNHRIRLVTSLGIVTTLAGSGSPTFADGMGTGASFHSPQGIAVIPSSGVVIVSDTDNNRIRLVTPLGVVTTLAGSGASCSFLDGTGAAASFCIPRGVAVMPWSSVIVVADYGNYRIRLVTPPLPPALAACDSTWHHVALSYSPSSSPFPLTAFLDGALAFQLASTVTLPSASASTLRVGWSGDPATNGGSLFTGSLAELRIYARTLTTTEVVALSQSSSGGTYSYGSGASATCAAGATYVSSSAGCTPSATLTAGPIDTAFYLSGSQAEGVAAFTVSALAGITNVAGPFSAVNSALALASGSYLSVPGASAPTALPSGGNVAWSASAWVKCTTIPGPWASVLEWGTAGDAQGAATAQAASLVVAGAAAATASWGIGGGVTTLAGSSSRSFADGVGAASSFYYPWGVAVIPSSGIIVVADYGNHRIRLVTPFGVVTTLAGSGSATFADGAGTAASFANPTGVAVIPSSGVVIVADQNNNRIRLVTPLGVVTTLAGSGSNSFADGTGSLASFNIPSGVAVIPLSGVVAVADMSNNRIRLVTPLGVVTTFAGSIQGYADGTGAAASFSNPQGVAVNPLSGVIVVAEYSNNRIRLITTPQPPALAACDSTWHHVALTYAPSATPYTLSAFLDGALAFQLATTITLPSAAASTLRVGSSGDLTTNGGSLFAGSLTELRVYARTLTATEVVALSQPPLAAYANAAAVPAAPALGMLLYSFSCSAGSSGTSASQIRGSDRAWFWAAGAAPSCTPCAAGSWSGPGMPACTYCPPGTYSLAGASSCSLCPIGTYGDRAGLATASCSGTCASCMVAGSTSALQAHMTCSAGDARAVPSSLSLQIWPAANTANTRGVDLLVAPLALCQQMTSIAACNAAASVVGADSVTRFVVGTAAAFNVEPAESLSCGSS